LDWEKADPGFEEENKNEVQEPKFKMVDIAVDTEF
jgi:hypothetical protein